VPVAATEATFKAIRHLVTPNMLIMDVGSTKRDVVDAARRVLREQMGGFVPAHPVAGREVAGVANADPDLYTGKQVILTPIERTRTVQLQQATDVWKAIGCHVTSMSPESHDAAFAAVSHLPHLLAFSLINAITGQPQGKEFLSWPAPAFATSPASQPASPTSGATSCSPIARSCLPSPRSSSAHFRPSSRPSAAAMPMPWKS